MGSRRLGCRCFAGAAEQGELVVNATNGGGSLEALRAADEANLDGKGADRHPQPPGPLPGHPAVPARLEHGLARGADPACAPPGEGREGARHDERVRDGRSLARRCRRAHGLRERERRAGQGPGDGDPALVRLEARSGPRRRHHRSWYRDVPALVAPDLGALGTGSSTSRSCSDRPDRRPGLPRHRRHLRDREGDRSGACRDRGDDSPGRAPPR